MVAGEAPGRNRRGGSRTRRYASCAVEVVQQVGQGAEEAGRRWRVVDHPAIVIDEVVGLWLAVLIPLTLIPLPVDLRWWLLLGALALFRVFDIAKPWPVSMLERSLPGGWGVVADDLMAGAMAGLGLTLSAIVLAAT